MDIKKELELEITAFVQLDEGIYRDVKKQIIDFLDYIDKIRHASGIDKIWNIRDITILDDFKNTPPAQWKLEAGERRYLQNGILPGEIVVNDDGELIDGYVSYLTAAKHGLKKVPVSIGCYEYIEAVHSEPGRVYSWAVPRELKGRVAVGDKCIVKTKRGNSCAKVKAVKTQQRPPSKSLKPVLMIAK